MTYSLNPYLNLIQSEYSKASALPKDAIGAYKHAYEFIFALISRDATGHEILHLNTAGNLVNRAGAVVNLASWSLASEADNANWTFASGVDAGAWAFLRGVPHVNNNEGAYSTFIRAYTKAQYLTRFGTVMSDIQVQIISNGIAENILLDILSKDQNNVNTGLNPNHNLPDINGIARNDARAAAVDVFQGEQIAGWAGNPFLLAVGHSQSFAANILEHQGDTYDLLAVIKSMMDAGFSGAFTPTALWNLFTQTLGVAIVSGAELTLANALLDANNFLEEAYGTQADLTDFIFAKIQLGRGGNESDVFLTRDISEYIHGGGGDDKITATLDIDNKDFIDGGAGKDSVDFSLYHGDVLVRTIATGHTGSTLVVETNYTLIPPTAKTYVYNIEELRLGDGNDDVDIKLTSNFLLDNLYTGDGRDTVSISGTTKTTVINIDLGGGDDKFTSGLEADKINGGTGVDTVSYVDSASLVNVNLTRTGVQFGGSATDDILSNVENIIGSNFKDVLTGDGNNNTITGGAGNDTLTGGGGYDVFAGNLDGSVDTVMDMEDIDRVSFDGTVVQGWATSTENGLYRLGNVVLQKFNAATGRADLEGPDLKVYGKDGVSAVIIKNFFSANYDSSQDYSFAGIVIPHDENDETNGGVAPNADGGHGATDKNTISVPLICPIALDLNGDGLQYLPYTNQYLRANTHFDIDNDGFAEGMEWLNPNDGFLVRDTNGNGKIDNKAEMFGDDGGTTAYAKLALLDTNHDNKIDASDTGFANLRIWQDLNGNGRTEAGELKTLAASGIANLSLQLSSSTTLNGHPIAGTSTFTKTDGTIGNAADVLLATYQVDTIYVGSDTSVTPNIDISTLFLPILRGYGTLPALQYAMTNDPLLKTMVSDFAHLDIATQMHEVYDRANSIILEWAGATNVGNAGADTNHNAAKTAVLQRFVDGDTSNLNIDLAYSTLLNTVVSKLLLQGPLQSALSIGYYDYSRDLLLFPQSGVPEFFAKAALSAPTNAVEKAVYWNEIARMVGAGWLSAVQSAVDFTLPTTPTMVGTSGNDILTIDYIYNTTSVVQGLAGNDVFYAYPSTKFIYNLGDGADTIISTNKSIGLPTNTEKGYIYEDSIYFGLGVSFNSLTFQSNANGVTIGLSDGGSISMNDKYGISNLSFADGTSKTSAEVNFKFFAGVGSASDDLLYGSSANDTINGFAGNDVIYGLDGNDIINAGDGNDKITGGTGADKIDGGLGSDTVDYSSSAAGVNIDLNLTTTAQSGGDATGDILSNIESIFGSKYDDTFIGNYSVNEFYGFLGINTVSYAKSTAGVTVNLAITTAQVSTGDASGDILYSIQNVIGSAFADTLFGGYENNSLSGGIGDDRLDGGDGNDILVGGSGADTFIISKSPSSNDIIKDFSPTTVGEVINLLGFLNPVDFAHLAISQVGVNTVITLENSQTITLENVLASNLTAANFTNVSVINGTTGNDFITGTAFDDTINGLAGDDKIIGSNGVNAINAGDGNDTVIGGIGIDKIDGGLGNDTVDYSSSAVGVNIDLNHTTTAQSGGDAAGDLLSNIENIIGSSYNDYFLSDSNANKFYGGSGSDTVNYDYSTSGVTINLNIDTAQSGGGAQGDILISIENIYGSTYDDYFIASASANYFQGNSNYNGIIGDTVDYSLSTSAINLNLDTNISTGGFAEGDKLSSINVVIGSNYDDIMIASGFSSTLLGGMGNDTLIGGMSIDTLTGGAGNDTVYGNDGDDIINGDAGADKIDGGNGYDTVDYSASTSAINLNLITNINTGGDAAGDTLFNIENIIGSAFDDNIFSFSTGSIITGGMGADKIVGGAGTDTASYATSKSAVNIDLNLATAQTGGDAAGDTLTSIENIIGSAFADKLTGDAGVNNIKGGAGNDIIIGGAGADTIDGGTGVDTASYFDSNAAVNVNLSINTAQSGGYAAGDILTGIENLIGSAFDDVLKATTKGSTLDGGAGNDTLTGGAGADSFIGGIGADIMNGAGGIDTVTYVASTAGVNINLTIKTAQSGGDAAGDTLTNIENIIGSAFSDTITGNASINNLNGGAGNDTISYTKSTLAVDVNLGIKTAQAGGDAAGDILSNFENIIGSGFNDVLTGSTVANIINGGAGNDTIYGGSGKDALTGGLGSDIFKFSLTTDSAATSGARDIITDFVEGTDKIDLSAFAGTFNFNGTGALSTGGVHSVDYAQTGGNTIIGVDVDGNGVLDFQIELTGLHTLAAGDFLL